MNSQQRKENKLKRRKRRIQKRFPNEVWLPESYRGLKTEFSYRVMREVIKQVQVDTPANLPSS